MSAQASLGGTVRNNYEIDRFWFTKSYPLWHVLEGDVLGCGIDFTERVIFFTKNGVLIGK